MKPWTQDEKKKALEAFARKASTDAKFRELALKNPAAAVKEVSGKDLPAGFKVAAVARDGADMVLVVPDLVKAGGELSDSELEKVAGGRCAGSCGISQVCLVSSTVPPGPTYVPGVGGACV